MYDIETAIGEARALHQHDKGWFAIFRKSPSAGRPSQRMYRLEQLDRVVGAIGADADTYISQGSFVRNSRKANALGQIGCAFVDIDCYKLSIVPDEHLVRDMLDEAKEAGLPLPSYVAFSGRGIYLKWLFDRPVAAAHLHRWQSLQSVLVPLYQSMGADAAVRDAVRVLRVIGSTNSSSGAKVRVLWDSQTRHNFDELCTAASLIDIAPLRLDNAAQVTQIERRIKRLLDDEPATSKEREAQAKASIAHLNDFAEARAPIMLSGISRLSLNWRRFLDLRDLTIARGGIKRGSRDLTLFWMGTFLAHSGIVTATNFGAEMADLADAFPGADFRPMTDGSLSSLLQRIEQHQRGERVHFKGHNYSPVYTPSNEHLINLFEIDESEQRLLTTIIGSAEKRRRSDQKCEGRAARRERRIEWRTLATQMATTAQEQQQRPSVTAIAAAVGVDKAQVSRLLAGKLRFGSNTKTPRFTSARRAQQDGVQPGVVSHRLSPDTPQSPVGITSREPTSPPVFSVTSRSTRDVFWSLAQRRGLPSSNQRRPSMGAPFDARPTSLPGDSAVVAERPASGLDLGPGDGSDFKVTSKRDAFVFEPGKSRTPLPVPVVAVFPVSKREGGLEGSSTGSSDRADLQGISPEKEEPVAHGPRKFEKFTFTSGMSSTRQVPRQAPRPSSQAVLFVVEPGADHQAAGGQAGSPPRPCAAVHLDDDRLRAHVRELRDEVVRQTLLSKQAMEAARQRDEALRTAEREQAVLRMKQQIESIRLTVMSKRQADREAPPGDHAIDLEPAARADEQTTIQPENVFLTLARSIEGKRSAPRRTTRAAPRG